MKLLLNHKWCLHKFSGQFAIHSTCTINLTLDLHLNQHLVVTWLSKQNSSTIPFWSPHLEFDCSTSNQSASHSSIETLIVLIHKQLLHTFYPFNVCAHSCCFIVISVISTTSPSHYYQAVHSTNNNLPLRIFKFLPILKWINLYWFSCKKILEYLKWWAQSESQLFIGSWFNSETVVSENNWDIEIERE